MKPAPIPPDEQERLAALREYRILDTEAEVEFDELTRLASYVCEVPIALITLIDADRQWFKACVGLDIRTTSRDVGFSAHAILQDDVFVVEDTLADERFHDNPLVTGPPNVRFYAGAPLITPDGRHIGTFCVMDRRPRKLTREQLDALLRLGRQVIPLLEYRRTIEDFHRVTAEREKAEAVLRDNASISRPTGTPQETVDRWRFWPAVLYLLGGLLLTALAVRIAYSVAMRGEEERFQSNAEQIDAAIARRMHDGVRVLDSAATLWSSQKEPAASDWRAFFKQHPIGDGSSGLSGVGFSEVVPRSQLQAFSDRLQAEYGPWASVRPATSGDVAYVVRLIEPVEIERVTIGFNLAGAPARRATAEQARDEGRAMITAPFSFDGKSQGFFVYRPVFRGGRVPDSVAARRAAHVGWVYSLIRAPDLMDQLPLNAGMRLTLTDGTTPFYANNASPGALPFQSKRRIALPGRSWTAVIDGSPDTRLVQREMEIALLAGVLVTLLFSGVVIALNTTRRRALRIAAEMTSGLRDSESRVRSIVEHIADAVIAFPTDGMLEAFNPAAERLFGTPPSSIIGRDVETILPSIRSAPKDGRTVQTIARRADGSEIPVELAVKPVPDDHRELTVAIVRDISQRLADHQRLQASEERYRDLFENSSDLIYSTDPEGNFFFANRAWFQTLGFDEFDLQRHRIFDMIDPESLPRCLELFERVMRGGTPEPIEAVFRARDGRPVHVEGNVTCRFDDHGRPVSLRGIWRDSTARKRAERELRTSQDQLGQLIENADDVIYRCDARGRFTFVNSTATRLLGYRIDELLGMSYLHLVRPDIRGIAREFYERQHTEHLPNTYLEFPVLTTDGRELWLEQKVQPVVENGVIIGYQGVARDVTERKQLESELEVTRDAALESARLKSQFLATMSHEIRTPMNGVIGMVGLMLETELTPEQREIAHTVQTSADSLLTIINDILDFSKIEAGKLSFELNEFDLADVIDGSVELFVSQARAKNVEIAALVENDVPRRLRGDAGRLRQILTNLIGNAVKFTDAGEVLMTAAIESDRMTTAVLRFTITDSGIGIDPDRLEHLFMPFVQADGTTTRRFGGTGLGLAICRQLVEMMNGEIGVESEPGKGSTFWFTAELEKQEPQPATPSFATPTRVLIVDGHAIHRRVFRHQVESVGLRADVAPSMDEALAMLHRAREEDDEFGAGIVDLRLDGAAFAYEARAEGFDLPLILVTSSGRRREDLETYHAAGFARVLMKPVRHSHLLNCLISLLGVPATHAVQHFELPERPVTRRMRILVAEDNRVNQRVVLAQLAELGHSAVAVGNGFEALAALDEIDYDAVLMDCQMPEMDGYEATEVIRGRKPFQRLPIIAMTASAMSGDRERCLAAGMDDYLTKPFGLAQLAQALVRIESRMPEPEPSLAVLDTSVLAEIGSMSPSNPDFVRELIAIFLEEAPARIETLRDAIAVHDPVATWRAAHAFKSGCANIGALRLVALCDAIEKHGRSGEVDPVRPLFAALESEYPELTALLAAHAGGAAAASAAGR
jgi:PAS domain S-box-containing protein